jgi:phospholipase D1/2
MDASGTRLPRAKLSATRLLKLILVLIPLMALPTIWRMGLFGEWSTFEIVTAWKHSLQHYPGTVFWVLGAYLIGSLVLFPVTILNVATVLTFGPVIGNAYALIGWLASASMGYGLGSLLGRELVHKWLGTRVHRLIGQVESHGFVAVLIMRLVPVAPFTLVNMFVGASGIRFWEFFLASLVGRIPGLVVLTLAGVQLEYFLRHPAVGGLIVLLIIVVVLPIVSQLLFKRWVAVGSREPYGKRRPTPKKIHKSRAQ